MEGRREWEVGKGVGREGVTWGNAEEERNGRIKDGEGHEYVKYPPQKTEEKNQPHLSGSSAPYPSSPSPPPKTHCPSSPLTPPCKPHSPPADNSAPGYRSRRSSGSHARSGARPPRHGTCRTGTHARSTRTGTSGTISCSAHSGRGAEVHCQRRCRGRVLLVFERPGDGCAGWSGNCG